MAARIFLRVDALEHEMFDNASEGVRLAWLCVLCEGARQGQGRKKFDIDDFCRRYKLAKSDVEEMIHRAVDAQEFEIKSGYATIRCKSEWLKVTGRSRPNGNQWRRIRVEILVRDAGLCRYCGAPANTVDHIFPYARGGTDDADNLAACCDDCNTRKGNRTPEEAGMVLRG